MYHPATQSTGDSLDDDDDDDAHNPGNPDTKKNTTFNETNPTSREHHQAVYEVRLAHTHTLM